MVFGWWWATGRAAVVTALLLDAADDGLVRRSARGAEARGQVWCGTDLLLRVDP